MCPALRTVVAFGALTMHPVTGLARPCGREVPCGAIVVEAPLPSAFPAGESGFGH
jgi:hypothetical protein